MAERAMDNEMKENDEEIQCQSINENINEKETQ